MVSFRLEESGDHAGLSRGIPQFLSDQVVTEELVAGRRLLNQCSHAVLVFDTQGRIIFRNHTAATRIPTTDSQQNLTAENAVWLTACESVKQIIEEAVQLGRAEFSAVFPVQQRNFIVCGSLTRLPSGRTSGALVNLTELRIVPGQRGLSYAGNGAAQPGYDSGPAPSAADESAFQQWVNRRADARRKMQKLSRREAQVAALVAEGLANKTIARKLDISVKTIEKHRANAVRKLGVCSTAEMVGIAVMAEPDPQDAGTQDTDNNGSSQFASGNGFGSRPL